MTVVEPEYLGRAVLARVAAMSPLDLAALAAVTGPVDDSAGARWLVRLRDEVVVAVIGYLDDDAPAAVGARRWQLDHGPALLADGCGPVEDADAWEVFVALRLWATPVELLALTGVTDLTGVARGALYLAALALGDALAGVLTEDLPAPDRAC